MQLLIDLRYHLVTLVAVFLALAVGMLVGNSFIVGSIGSSIERQVAKGLEQQLGKLLAENRDQQRTIEALHEQIKKNVEFDNAVAPALVEGQLPWHRVAIIQTGDYTEAAQSAKSILEKAGARVISVTTLSNPGSPSARERAARAVELITGETQTGDPIGPMLDILANCIATGSNPEAMSVLEEKGLLSIAGDYDRRVSDVVLVGGDRQKGSKRAQQIDLALIDKLKAAGVLRLVGAEPVDAVTSYIPIYHRKAIPTVDNVDQPMGQVALIFALAGETGSFGVKRWADRVAPASLENGQWRMKSRR